MSGLIQGKAMRSLCIYLSFLLAFSVPVLAQDGAATPPGTPPNDYEEIKHLLGSIQARIDKMNKRTSETDAALRFLDEQVLKAMGRLTSRQDENVALRDEAAELTNELGYLTNTRKILEAELARLGNERNQSVIDLENEVSALSRQLALEQNSLEDLRKNLDDTNLLFDDAVIERDELANTREILEAELARLGNERDQSVIDLENEVSALSRQLALEQNSLEDLRKNLDDTNLLFDTAITERDETRRMLEATKIELKDGADKLKTQQNDLDHARLDISTLMENQTRLDKIVATSKKELDGARVDLARASARNESLSLEVDERRILGTDLKEELERINSLRQDLTALLAARTDEINIAKRTLEARNLRIEELATEVDERRILGTDLKEELERINSLRQDLTALLAARTDEINIAKRTLEARNLRIEELATQTVAAERSIAQERTATQAAQSQANELTRQLVLLRQQLVEVNRRMAQTKETNIHQKMAILELEQALNRTLTKKVAELARYRSEFFGRLREVLDFHKGIRVEGDRFVFQAEVLFDTGDAQLEQAGREQLKRLAETLSEIARTIPADVDWLLRVDGHTDVRAIKTDLFPSNWELSTARATSVVKFLVSAGIPAKRLAATGFGEYHPIDPREDEIAYRRNRRIEFKLTQR